MGKVTVNMELIHCLYLSQVVSKTVKIILSSALIKGAILDGSLKFFVLSKLLKPSFLFVVFLAIRQDEVDGNPPSVL